MTTVSPPFPGPGNYTGLAEEVRTLVKATAPRLFAVVETYEVDDEATTHDARVAAWGLAHKDGSAQVTAADGTFRMSLRSPERAAQLISRLAGSEGSIVWADETRTDADPDVGAPHDG